MSEHRVSTLNVIDNFLVETIERIKSFKMTCEDFKTTIRELNKWKQGESEGGQFRSKLYAETDALCCDILIFCMNRYNWCYAETSSKMRENHHDTSRLVERIMEIILRINDKRSRNSSATNLCYVLTETRHLFILSPSEEQRLNIFISSISAQMSRSVCISRSTSQRNQPAGATGTKVAPVSSTRKLLKAKGKQTDNQCSQIESKVSTRSRANKDTKNKTVPQMVDKRIKVGILFGSLENSRTYDAVQSLIMHGDANKFSVTLFGLTPSSDAAENDICMAEVEHLYDSMPGNEIIIDEKQVDKNRKRARIAKTINYVFTQDNTRTSGRCLMHGYCPINADVQEAMIANFKSINENLDVLILLLSCSELTKIDSFIKSRPAKLVLLHMGTYNAGASIFYGVDYVLSDRYTITSEDNNNLYHGRVKAISMTHASINLSGRYPFLRYRKKFQHAGRSFVLQSSYRIHDMWSLKECGLNVLTELESCCKAPVLIENCTSPSFRAYNHRFYLPNKVLAMSPKQRRQILVESGDILITCRGFYELPESEDELVLACFSQVFQLVRGYIMETWQKLLTSMKNMHVWLCVPQNQQLRDRITRYLTKTGDRSSSSRIKFYTPTQNTNKGDDDLDALLRASVCTIGTDVSEASSNARDALIFLASQVPYLSLKSATRISNESGGIFSSLNLTDLVATTTSEYSAKLDQLCKSRKWRNEISCHLRKCVKGLPPFNCALQVFAMETIIESLIMEERTNDVADADMTYFEILNDYPAPESPKSSQVMRLRQNNARLVLASPPRPGTSSDSTIETRNVLPERENNAKRKRSSLTAKPPSTEPSVAEQVLMEMDVDHHNQIRPLWKLRDLMKIKNEPHNNQESMQTTIGQNVINIACFCSACDKIFQNMADHISNFPAGLGMVYSFVLRLQEYFQQGFPRYDSKHHAQFFQEFSIFDSMDAFMFVHYHCVFSYEGREPTRKRTRRQVKDKRKPDIKVAVVAREDCNLDQLCRQTRFTRNQLSWKGKTDDELEKQVVQFIKCDNSNVLTLTNFQHCLFCDECIFEDEEATLSLYAYAEHHRTKMHTNRVSCLRCGKSFKDTDELASHNSSCKDHNRASFLKLTAEAQTTQTNHDGVCPVYHETVSSEEHTSTQRLDAQQAFWKNFFDKNPLDMPMEGLKEYETSPVEWKTYHEGQRVWTYMWLMERVMNFITRMMYEDSILPYVSGTGFFGLQVLQSLQTSIRNNPLSFLPRLSTGFKDKAVLKCANDYMMSKFLQSFIQQQDGKTFSFDEDVFWKIKEFPDDLFCPACKLNHTLEDMQKAHVIIAPEKKFEGSLRRQDYGWHEIVTDSGNKKVYVTSVLPES